MLQISTFEDYKKKAKVGILLAHSVTHKELCNNSHTLISETERYIFYEHKQ